MLVGIGAGVCLYSKNLGGVLMCSFTAFAILLIMGAINDDFHDRVKTYGTYPDTMITITKGVCDTTIIHKVYKYD